MKANRNYKDAAELRPVVVVMEQPVVELPPPPPPVPAVEPNPVCFDVDEDDVSDVRRVDCVHYERCLNVAVRAKWPSFSCGSCLVTLVVPRTLQLRQGHEII